MHPLDVAGSGFTAADLVAIIGAISALGVALITAWRTGTKVDTVHTTVQEVKQQVTASNGHTLADIAEATASKVDADVPPHDFTQPTPTHPVSGSGGAGE